MSGSESRPRKVELASAHKKRDDYREYFTHNNEACKNSYKNNLTALIYSLVNGLFKISTESLKLVLDDEQSGASSDLIVPTRDVQKESFFSFFFYASSLRHSMDSTEIPSSTFQPTFYHKV